MQILRNYNIFISHAWKYDDDYKRLIDLLEKAPNFKYTNYSAPEDKPSQDLDSTDIQAVSLIQGVIRRKINPASCVLVLSGLYYDNRKWMQYELDVARRLRKPILAVKPSGNQPMPQEVQSYASTIVNWSTDSIVDAIRYYCR